MEKAYLFIREFRIDGTNKTCKKVEGVYKFTKRNKIELEKIVEEAKKTGPHCSKYEIQTVNLS